jgi:hypothetical protein
VDPWIRRLVGPGRAEADPLTVEGVNPTAIPAVIVGYWCPECFERRGDFAAPLGSLNPTQRACDNPQLEDAVNRRKVVLAAPRLRSPVGIPRASDRDRRDSAGPRAAVPLSRDRSTLGRRAPFTRERHSGEDLSCFESQG